MLEHGSGVHGCALRPAQALLVVLEPVEIADHHGDVADAVLDQGSRQSLHGGAGGLLEARTQGEVLDRVAGHEHLGQRHQLGSGCHRLHHRRPRAVRIAGQIAHRGVGLHEGQAQGGHGGSVKGEGHPA